MKKKIRKKYCLCCEGEIEMSFGGTKYCNNCGLHTRELRRELGTLKYRLKELEKK